MSDQLVSIDEVAEEFGLKVRTMREYRRLRIIEPVKRVKGSDKYVRVEVKRAAKIVDNNSFKTLSEVSKIVIKDRDKYRKAIKSSPRK